MLIHKFRYFALSHSLKTINKSSLLCSVQLNRNENVVAFWMKCIEFELCVHLRVEMIIWATNKQTTAAAAAICRMLFSVCLFFFNFVLFNVFWNRKTRWIEDDGSDFDDGKRQFMNHSHCSMCIWLQRSQHRCSFCVFKVCFIFCMFHI